MASLPPRSGSSAPSVGTANSVSQGLWTATAQVLHRGVAVLFCPCASCFASRKVRRALVGTVWWSRSVLSVMPRHSIMMGVCPPRRDDVASCPFARTGNWNSIPL
jgi:hypothetical protein